MRKVKVHTEHDMERSINSYIANGYMVMNKTSDSAILSKPKKFNVAIGIISFLFCVIGLCIYAIIYSCQSDEIVEIVIE